MKNLFLLLFLGFSHLMSSDEGLQMKDTKISIHELKIQCESAEELKAIDWENIQRLLEENEPNQELVLEFGVFQKERQKELQTSPFYFKISGKSKEVLRIVKKVQKGVNSIEKLSSKI